jgi:hypothetical protein
VADNGTVMGVEIAIIESILKMIHEKYPAFDKGTYFLAITSNKSNDIGNYNIRDMVTHFHTAILPGKTTREREDQIVMAEEHLRRALVEPYELAALEIVDKLENIKEEYCLNLYIARKRDKELMELVSESEIEEKIAIIRGHLEKGREKKSSNLWNGEWEEAVEAFTAAVEIGQIIYKTIKMNIDILKSRNIYHQNKIYFIWAVTATILSCILGILATYYLF